MFTALNMELDIVRSVLKNEVNEVSVCADRLRDSDVFYTLISVHSRALRKELARRMATSGLFLSNSDFVGSFTYRDSLNLVFRYHSESNFLNKEVLYAETFADRKAIALSFLTAMAETQLQGDIGSLLLAERNINIGPGGKVYLNYFLDFAELPSDCSEKDFYRGVAEFTFGILGREYAVKYDGQVEEYPDELRLLHRKTLLGTFRSYNQIMTSVKALSDKQREQRRGVMRALDWLLKLKDFVAAHTMEVFLGVVVAVALFFLGNYLVTRLSASRDTRENTAFVGLQEIGEVYLGDEEV